MMSAFSDYICQLLEQGYSERVIESHLESYGYTASQIRSAMQKAKRQMKTNKSSSTAQLSQQLKTYAYTMLERGYQPSQIRQALKTQGYGNKTICALFSTVNDMYYDGRLDIKRESNSRATSIALRLFVIVAVIAGFALVGFFTMPSVDDTPQRADDTTRSQSNDNQPDRQDEFRDDETQKPSEPYDNTDTNRTSRNKSGPENRSEVSLASYGRPDTMSRGPSVKLSESDSFHFEQAMNSDTASEAIPMCDRIINENGQIDCYSSLSLDYGNVSLCEKLDSSKKIEDCRMNLILNGKTELCSEMTAPENKQFCDEMKMLDASS
ncbi:MAG: hypothetical protein ACOCZV_01945 [Nanoarchaeota archaeon]